MNPPISALRPSLVGKLNERQVLRVIQARTLLIWGLRDIALRPELTAGLESWVPSLRVERVPEAGHWVQHEQPDLVNRLLLEHLSGSDS